MASSSTRSSANASGGKLLTESFYARDTIRVARELLGKVVRCGDVAGRIVECEAYTGDDPASHASRGETPRASIMFGPPGVAYVYFIYGMYEMLNFVTEKEGKPGAVLIRALEPVSGEATMARRRATRLRSRTDLTSGPGKLCRALGIRISDNGASLEGPRITVHDDGFRPERISASPRVGITQATDRYWRFFITDHPFVSRSPENRKARVLSRPNVQEARA